MIETKIIKVKSIENEEIMIAMTMIKITIITKIMKIIKLIMMIMRIKVSSRIKT